MIRPILTEIALFLTPFAIYALFLVMRKNGLRQSAAWSISRITGLLIVSLVLMVTSFVLLAQFSGAPPGSVYEPAHMEGGKLVPGVSR